MWALNKLEYFRLWLVTIGIGYLLWRYCRKEREESERLERETPTLLGLAFVFLLNQFMPDGIRAGSARLWISSGLVVLAFVTACWNKALWETWNWRDWVAIGLGAVPVGVSVGAYLIKGKEINWGGLVTIAASVLVWFAATRTVVREPEASKKLSWGVLGVCILVSLAGVGQFGVVYYFTSRGEQAREDGEWDVAAGFYQRAMEFSERLELNWSQKKAAFALAGVLVAQDENEQAAEVLGLEPGFVQVIPADDWEGPVGGNLYYQTSCWKKVTLFPEEVEIRIFARGTSALDVWPLMQVDLGEDMLSRVSVTSQELRPYIFTVPVRKKDQKRLKISFLNDYHRTNPDLDRNLRIEQAEIQYRRIAWE